MKKYTLFLLTTFLTFALFTLEGFSQTNIPSSTVETNTASPIIQTNLLIWKPDNDTSELLKEIREATNKSWPEWIQNSALTILGGIIGALAGYFASRRIHKLEVRQKGIEEKEFKDNIQRAILYELEVTSKVYDNGIGEHQKKLAESLIFPVKLSLTQDWFTVYNQNAIHLGKLDGEISRQIIIVYGSIKALIEEFKINTEYLEQNIFNDGRLIEQFKRIKVAQKKCTESYEALKVMFAKRGITL